MSVPSPTILQLLSVPLQHYQWYWISRWLECCKLSFTSLVSCQNHPGVFYMEMWLLLSSADEQRTGDSANNTLLYQTYWGKPCWNTQTQKMRNWWPTLHYSAVYKKKNICSLSFIFSPSNQLWVIFTPRLSSTSQSIPTVLWRIYWFPSIPFITH